MNRELRTSLLRDEVMPDFQVVKRLDTLHKLVLDKPYAVRLECCRDTGVPFLRAEVNRFTVKSFGMAGMYGCFAGRLSQPYRKEIPG